MFEESETKYMLLNGKKKLIDRSIDCNLSLSSTSYMTHVIIILYKYAFKEGKKKLEYRCDTRAATSRIVRTDIHRRLTRDGQIDESLKCRDVAPHRENRPRPTISIHKRRSVGESYTHLSEY